MTDHRAHGTHRRRNGKRRAGEFRPRAESTGRRAVTRRIKCHDAMSTREQGAAQVYEPRASAAPSMHEQNARATLAPCPRGDPSVADGHVESPRVAQPAGHALADRATRW